MSRTTGELVTETLAYDGGRAVTACVPTERPEAMVLAGDGQSSRRGDAGAKRRTYRPR